MNCILFEKSAPLLLERTSETAEHLKKVLKAKTGDEIFAGFVGGEMFMARVELLPSGNYKLEKTRTLQDFGCEPLNVSVCVAFARPQIAKRILFEAACFGVKNLAFYPAQKGDESYLKSSLYAKGEFRKYLIKGAEQACSSKIPNFLICNDFNEALEAFNSENSNGNEALRFAPDPYESKYFMGERIFQKFSDLDSQTSEKFPVFLALGGERGFSAEERTLLKSKSFELVSLGNRILRTDSAFICCLSIALAATSKTPSAK